MVWMLEWRMSQILCCAGDRRQMIILHQPKAAILSGQTTQWSNSKSTESSAKNRQCYGDEEDSTGLPPNQGPSHEQGQAARQVTEAEEMARQD